MKTFKSEFIKKGLALPEVLNREEFVGGEIAYSRSGEINTITQSLYHKPPRNWHPKERSGRTKILEVKKLMEEKRIQRDNAGLRILDILHKQSGNWSAYNFLYKTLSTEKPISRGTISGFLSVASNAGIIESRPLKEGRGYEYRLTDKTMPPEASYLAFRSKASAALKRDKIPAKQTAPKTLISDMSQIVRVIVEGNITVTFKVS